MGRSKSYRIIAAVLAAGVAAVALGAGQASAELIYRYKANPVSFAQPDGGGNGGPGGGSGDPGGDNPGDGGGDPGGDNPGDGGGDPGDGGDGDDTGCEYGDCLEWGDPEPEPLAEVPPFEPGDDGRTVPAEVRFPGIRVNVDDGFLFDCSPFESHYWRGLDARQEYSLESFPGVSGIRVVEDSCIAEGAAVLSPPLAPGGTFDSELRIAVTDYDGWDESASSSHATTVVVPVQFYKGNEWSLRPFDCGAGETSCPFTTGRTGYHIWNTDYSQRKEENGIDGIGIVGNVGASCHTITWSKAGGQWPWGMELLAGNRGVTFVSEPDWSYDTRFPDLRVKAECRSPGGELLKTYYSPKFTILADW